MKRPTDIWPKVQTTSRGFTLIELLVTMGVAGILMALAVPAFNNFILNDRDATQINSLVASLNYARSEAVKRNATAGVTVCPSGDSATCNSPTGGWSGGWIILDNVPGDLPLQAVPQLAGTNVVSATGGGANGITFKSSGGVSATTTTKIKICDTRGSAFARDVEVSVVGNIAASQIPGQDASGVALTCP